MNPATCRLLVGQISRGIPSSATRLSVLGTAPLTGVDRDVKPGVVRELERLAVLEGRELALRAGEVDADDAVPPELGGKLNGFDRVLRRFLLECREDQPGLNSQLFLGAVHASENGGHHVAGLEVKARVQQGRKSDLHVDDVLGCGVGAELVGRSFECRRGLEEGHREPEGSKVVLERPLPVRDDSLA
jgi:hypothetical protein